MKKIIIALIIIVIFSTSALAANNNWKFEFLTGVPHNLLTPLKISQEGEAEIYLKQAKYDSKPLQVPIYYSWRLGKWGETEGLELEVMHQKLYLQNKPDTVQHFEVSHGYNLVTINKAWKLDETVVRLGAGMVLAHPKTTVRGKTLFESGGILDTGYYLGGSTFGASAARQISITEQMYFSAEGKVTGSYAQIPINDGEAEVPNVALHLLLGIGYKF
jgi:hypothetical protein